jgi:hypothetical protein
VGDLPAFDGPSGPLKDGPLPLKDGPPAKPDANPANCQAEIAALTKSFEPPKAWTAVVRLDHNSFKLLGFAIISGAYSAVSESQARITAQKFTGYGAGGKALNAANPGDEYVFYESPGDFGGAAAVSADSGQAVFGGSIIWMGTGQIVYPSTWQPTKELGTNCPSAGGIKTSKGYDLVGGTALAQTDVDKVIQIVAQTAIPAAMWTQGYVFDAVVLRYPRSVGVFDPSTAEWIALVNGGWLE